MKDETRKLLEKAARALAAAELLLRQEHVESAAGRVYYAMPHVAQALLNEEGLRFRKHGGVHAAFGERFVKSGRLDQKFHRWLLDAFDKRLESDYGVDLAITSEDVASMISQARDFLQTSEGLLAR